MHRWQDTRSHPGWQGECVVHLPPPRQLVAADFADVAANTCGASKHGIAVPQVLELGASIIHGANQYMLSLAREMNLTLAQGDDTGATFSIWDGSNFVFSQVPPDHSGHRVALMPCCFELCIAAGGMRGAAWLHTAAPEGGCVSPRMHLLMRVLLLVLLLVQTGNALADFWAVAKRYGVTPLRCAQEGGGRPGCQPWMCVAHCTLPASWQGESVPFRACATPQCRTSAEC